MEMMERYKQRSQLYSNFARDEGEERRGSPEHFACAGLGLVGEAGEVADYLKKVCYHKHTLDRAKLCAELGDTLWYVAMAAEAIGIPMPDAGTEIVPVLPRLQVLFAIRLSVVAASAAEHLAEHAFHVHELGSPPTSITHKLKQVVYHIQAVGLTAGLGLEDIIQANLDKLAARYPEGHFTTARSINRVG